MMVMTRKMTYALNRSNCWHGVSGAINLGFGFQSTKCIVCTVHCVRCPPVAKELLEFGVLPAGEVLLVRRHGQGEDGEDRQLH